MNTPQLSPGCNLWQLGDPTKHPPRDEAFLGALANAGFLPFTGPSGLCGARSETRTVVVVHRGRGIRWEIFFRENDTDMVTTTTSNLSAATEYVLAWLRGEALSVGEDSLHSVTH